MTLRKRIDRLAAKHGMDGRAGPAVVFLCEAGGEVRASLLMDGGTLSRHDGETEAAFIARASEGAADVASACVGRHLKLFTTTDIGGIYQTKV